MKDSILLVEDDSSIAIVITAALEAEGFHVDRCDSIAGRDCLLASKAYGLMLTDVMLTDGDGIETLPPVRAAFPRMQVIILSAQNTLDTAVRASDTGAFEYFPSRSTWKNWCAPCARPWAAAKAATCPTLPKTWGRACRWSAAARRCRRSTA
jgi:DNA-binding NtrC family response regulator